MVLQILAEHSFYAVYSVPFSVLPPSRLNAVLPLLEIILDSPSPQLLLVLWPPGVSAVLMAHLTQAAVC